MNARRVVVCIALASVCNIGVARANGRFPQAQAIVTVPRSDGRTVFLRATFGILVSRDAGATWRFVCERALGYEGTWDPPIAATRDGRLWVGLESGLVSTTDGCDVAPSPELAGETVKDLTTDASGDAVWAITGAPGKTSWIWRRPAGDAARARFERLGGLADTNFMTIEVAPSRPARVYVSGQPYGTVRGRLYRSDDGGRTLIGDKNDLEAEGPFFIAAVDAQDASRVLVRHLHTAGSDLLSTTDGGKTFKNVLSMKSAMFGFAKAPNGTTYWAGSGLPEHGIFRSTDRGETWHPVSQHGVLCLHGAPDGRLFVCENPLTLGAPAIAVSRDGGKTVEPIATFADVAGPVACPRRDAGAWLCEASWPETRAQIVARGDAAHSTAAGSDEGRGGGRSRDGEGGAATARGASAAPPSKCGCTLVGARLDAPAPARVAAAVAALAALLAFRRARGSALAQAGRRELGGRVVKACSLARRMPFRRADAQGRARSGGGGR